MWLSFEFVANTAYVYLRYRDTILYDFLIQRHPTEKAYYIAKELLMTERTYKKDLEVIDLVTCIIAKPYFQSWILIYFVFPVVSGWTQQGRVHAGRGADASV